MATETTSVKRTRTTKTAKVITEKDLIGLEYLTDTQIMHILDTAKHFKEVQSRAIKKLPTLRGKTIANLFMEPSTRTRSSFEIAEKRLSADVINLSSGTSSITKGETMEDTAKNLEALGVDIIVMRNNLSGAPNTLASHCEASVINAGDGFHEHPTQGLLDMFTIRENRGKVEGLKISIIGDILHSRVARSNIWGMTKLGAEVTLCAPPTLIPREIQEFVDVKITYDLDEAIQDADIIYVLRIQFERHHENFFPTIREYTGMYGITTERMKKAKPDVLIMHPGPVNRGWELAPEVADDPRSLILQQVTSGIAARMAVLYLFGGGKQDVFSN
jgi:aspartate carbamoyltransferase catalytic subunit